MLRTGPDAACLEQYQVDAKGRRTDLTLSDCSHYAYILRAKSADPPRLYRCEPLCSCG